jgi:hypothetical protein
MDDIDCSEQDCSLVRHNRRESEALYILNSLCDVEDADYSPGKNSTIGPWSYNRQIKCTVYTSLASHPKSQTNSQSKNSRTRSMLKMPKPKKIVAFIRTPKISNEKMDYMPQLTQKKELLNTQYLHFNSSQRNKPKEKKYKLSHLRISSAYEPLAVPASLQHFFTSDFKVSVKDCVNHKPVIEKISNSYCTKTFKRMQNTTISKKPTSNILNKEREGFNIKGCQCGCR